MRGTFALDDLLAFSDPSTCEPAEAHARLLSAMVAGDANEGFRAGHIAVPASKRRAFGPVRVERHDSYTVVAVATRGTLFGLPLTGIEQALPEGGDPGDVTYRFAASTKLVETALRSRGIPAKAGEAVAMGVPDGYEHVVELLPDPARSGHSLVSCGFR